MLLWKSAPSAQASSCNLTGLPDKGAPSYFDTSVINTATKPAAVGFPLPTTLAQGGGGSAPGLVSTLLTSRRPPFISGTWQRNRATWRGAALNSKADSRGAFPDKADCMGPSPSSLISFPILSLLPNFFQRPQTSIGPLIALKCLCSFKRLLSLLRTTIAWGCPSLPPLSHHPSAGIDCHRARHLPGALWRSSRHRVF